MYDFFSIGPQLFFAFSEWFLLHMVTSLGHFTSTLTFLDAPLWIVLTHVFSDISMFFLFVIHCTLEIVCLSLQ